ncbi:tRNA (guanosine(37)-N1)-methyltransferase TrmD, partial [Paenibacillus sp. GYB003]
MRIDVLTLFPAMFEGVFGSSILGKARDKGIVALNTVNFRDFANNKHNTVDDYPFGGGGGMVLKPEPIFGAVEHVTEASDAKPRVILMCPQGETFTQRKAEQLA